MHNLLLGAELLLFNLQGFPSSMAMDPMLQGLPFIAVDGLCRRFWTQAFSIGHMLDLWQATQMNYTHCICLLCKQHPVRMSSKNLPGDILENLGDLLKLPCLSVRLSLFGLS